MITPQTENEIDSDAQSDIVSDEKSDPFEPDFEVKVEATDSEDDTPLDYLMGNRKIERLENTLIRPIKSSHFTKPIHCSVIAHTQQVINQVILN